LYSIEVEICHGVKRFYFSVDGKRRKKLLPGQGFYNMPISILSAATTMRMLNRHILPQNASI